MLMCVIDFLHVVTLTDLCCMQLELTLEGQHLRLTMGKLNPVALAKHSMEVRASTRTIAGLAVTGSIILTYPAYPGSAQHEMSGSACGSAA